MNRKQFLINLSIISLVSILGCNGLPTEPNNNEEFMGKAKGKTGMKAKVKFRVIDKDGNVKQEGSTEGKVVPNPKKVR